MDLSIFEFLYALEKKELVSITKLIENFDELIVKFDPHALGEET